MVSLIRQKPILFFFILAFLISWILWIPLLIGHFIYGWSGWEGNAWSNIPTLLGLLGSLGPAIAAIFVTYLIDGKDGVKLLLKKVVQWRVKILWWLIGFYLWWLVASLISALFNLKSLQDIALQFGFSLINIPVIIFFLQLPLLIGMFGEELGWRGFALPKLLEKFDPIVSSLILAIPWIFWHAPLAFFPEWRGNMPVMDHLVNYVLLVLPLTLIFTWFFQKSNGSILLIMVFHKAFNLTFNAYSIAVGLDKESSKILWDKLIIALWIFAGILIVYYLRKMKKKAVS